MDPLAFIAALIWPAVVVFVVLYFRQSIRAMVSNVQVKSVKAFGAEVELERTAEKAVAKLVDDDPDALDATPEPVDPETPARVDVEVRPPRATADVEAHPPTVTGSSGRQIAPTDDITMTRKELEDLVAEFAEIGWISAMTLPFKSQPRPVIKWDGNRPRVTLWTSDRA